MRLTCSVRDLLLLTWEVPPGALARRLPAGVTPALTAAGGALVSLASARVAGTRLGRMPAPGWKQIALRTYVEVNGEPALFFLALRVTTGGLGAAAFGVPVRPLRARVDEGMVRSRGLGVYARYRRVAGSAAVPQLTTGPVGGHAVAYLPSAGLRRLQSSHSEFAFEPAELTEPLRVDPLLALGLDSAEPSSALYAARTDFVLELPPSRVPRA